MSICIEESGVKIFAQNLKTLPLAGILLWTVFFSNPPLAPLARQLLLKVMDLLLQKEYLHRQGAPTLEKLKECATKSWSPQAAWGEQSRNAQALNLPKQL